MTRAPFDFQHAQQLKFIVDAGFVAGARYGYFLVAEIEDSSRETHSLWLFERDGSNTQRLAADHGDLSAATPAPDGSSFAVLVEVDGKKQVFRVPMDDGAVGKLTDLPQGVTSRPVWSSDGRSIAFSAGPTEPRDPSLPYRVDRVTYRYDALGYLDDAIQDIYVVDVANATVQQLTNDRNMNSDPQWSPDGRSISYLVSFPPDQAWTQLPELHLLTVNSGETRTLVSDWGVSSVAWCDDGERIAFAGCRTGGNWLTQKLDIWTVDLAGGEPECRTTNLEVGIGSRIQADLPNWEQLATPRICVRGEDCYVSGQVGGDIVIYRVKLNGPESVERVLETDGCAYLFDFDTESGILHVATSFLDPPELVLGSTPITALNEELMDKVERPDVHVLEVTAEDGLRTEAWALTPPGEDGPWPTVLYIHGGPYGAFGSTYMIDFQLLVGAGFAVVLNNFRGSGGYGSDFLEMIVGNWGPAGSLDHHATVDEAVRAGIADPDRIGVCGYSHGGFATCWLVGTSDRFRAAVAENPTTSWTSAYGEMDIDWFIVKELGGAPHEVPDVYRHQSPLTHAPNCTTPLLFVIGEADMRCHPVESEQYYRVLKSRGVPSEMLRLPNSTHIGTWNGPVAGRIAQNEALVDWFSRFLK